MIPADRPNATAPIIALAALLILLGGGLLVATGMLR